MKRTPEHTHSVCVCSDTHTAATRVATPGTLAPRWLTSSLTGVARAAGDAVARRKRRRDIDAAVRTLSRLDDRVLTDIGVPRSEIGIRARGIAQRPPGNYRRSF